MTVKISHFWKSNMAAATILNTDILKITKITISQQRIDWSSRNLAWLCKMGLFTAPGVKNLNFQNPRWRVATILKTVKSPYICNHSTDFDEMWQGDANWPPTGERQLKYQIFQHPRWQPPPSWKSQKSRYLSNGLTDLRKIWQDDAWTMSPQK